jgi:hypothetical protein
MREKRSKESVMTISSQTLTETEKNKLSQLLNSKTGEERENMEKQLAGIVQNAIMGAGQAQADAIKSRIAQALRRTFPL